jgi:acyl transferase domain-containing protein
MAPRNPAPIAVIGMGCRFPGAANGTEAFWSLVAEGRHGWTRVPETRFNEDAFHHPDPGAPGAINQEGGHFLDQDIADFDAAFFGISPLEAETLDPQQRVLLEVAWEAVENAGIPMDKFQGSETAVFGKSSFVCTARNAWHPAERQ